ncbi:7-cyano-7-deazaguanine reductase [Prosthecobacter fusiformis]|uniref:NADPH-dependent 7-cyano-7-deazaguanine reductase n=2 Tax=Prosthecobacter fusiformis TaxID=48464 RepID=A0A4R7RL77_9BACT|nr:7-cyano-7-deazaguanine reductase [Prosthecobacter fusiformis]
MGACDKAALRHIVEIMSDSLTADITLLGRSEHRLPASPDEAALETFPNRTPGRNYTIHLSAPDFGSLCPVTGQPDAAHVEILYIPDERCVETKSLKFYLASYRNHASFNEAIVNRILDDLVAACAPKQAIVRGRFVPRGGIQLTCEARHPSREIPLEWPAASLSTPH